MDDDLSNALKRCASYPTIPNLVQIKSEMTSTQATSNHHPSSRESSTPSPILNIFTPRTRRYSTSYSPLAGNNSPGPPRLTPRVSQLRLEECADISNSREVNHEREIHSNMQISQSWEDLTLVAENWSCKSEDMTHPLQVALPTGPIVCSSPSPTRSGLRYLTCGLSSPSPTRKTFQTRRSMSPIAMRPSSLGPVKRKFELDEGFNNCYSQPPLKKMFTERGPSPSICQTPPPICPSPDSYEGRTTPKLFISKLYTNSTTSSPLATSPMMEIAVDITNSTTDDEIKTIDADKDTDECHEEKLKFDLKETVAQINENMGDVKTTEICNGLNDLQNLNNMNIDINRDYHNVNNNNSVDDVDEDLPNATVNI